MRTIVVYRSKSGYTKKYAQWIAQQTGADLREGHGVKIGELMRYDTIVYGAGTYAGGINGISLIKKNLWRLKGKKVIVFTLGASPVREATIAEIRDGNFSPKEQKQIKFFMLRGGFDFKKLTTWDKFLMLLLKARLKRKKEPTADERGMLNAYSRPMDFTDKRHIAPIVEEIMK